MDIYREKTMKLMDLVKEIKKPPVQDEDDDWGEPELYILVRYLVPMMDKRDLNELQDQIDKIVHKHRGAFCPTSNRMGRWFEVTVMGLGKEERNAEKLGKELVITNPEPYSVVIYTVGSEKLVKAIRY